MRSVEMMKKTKKNVCKGREREESYAHRGDWRDNGKGNMAGRRLNLAHLWAANHDDHPARREAKGALTLIRVLQARAIRKHAERLMWPLANLYLYSYNFLSQPPIRPFLLHTSIGLYSTHTILRC